MRFVFPSVTLIARTEPNMHGLQAWLKKVGVESPEQIIPSDASPGETLTMLAGKRCYLSFEPGLNANLTRVRSDVTQFIEHLLSSRHGSVLEHTNYTFAIEHVSRVFTGEMNRHRAGWAISEGSGRFIRQTHPDGMGVVLPNMLRDAPDDDAELRLKKEMSRGIFIEAFNEQEQYHKRLCDIWGVDRLTDMPLKKRITSMARRVIGIGAATGGIWTGNLRAIRHFLSVRVAPAAEEEICEVGMKMFDIISEQEREIFKDFERTDDGFLTPAYWKI